MKILKRVVGLCFLLVISVSFYGEISISASVDKNVVSLNDQLTLQVVISGNVNNLPNPTLPDLTDFQVYSSGRSQNISIINGQISSTVSFNYILSPRKIGNFTINPVSINYQGKIYQTQPINVQVVQAQQKQLPVQNNVYRGDSRGLFIETVVDKNNVYVNEQITLTFRFYTKVNLLSQPQYTAPDTTGFVVEDLPPQRNYYTTINNERYYVSEIKTALFPTTPGKYTIGPATVRCMIEDFDREDFFSDRFFSRFFSSGKEVVLKSNPITITVLPLPPNSESSGAVGEYNIKSVVDKTTVESGQTIMFNVEISGTGNIKSVILPKEMIESSLKSNFVVFDPITSFDVTKENYVVKGKKVFQIPISPITAGQVEIPSLKYTYFSPKEKSYKSVYSQPIRITVLPSKNVDVKSDNLLTKTFQNQTKLEIKDIRYIKLKMKLSDTDFNVRRWFFVQTLPLISFVVFLFYRIYNKKFYSDIKKIRFSRAYKNFKTKIKKINKQQDLKLKIEIFGKAAPAHQPALSKQAPSGQGCAQAR
ncbi:MAG: BatD family protein, partial [Endomicrobiia bacterium]